MPASGRQVLRAEHCGPLWGCSAGLMAHGAVRRSQSDAKPGPGERVNRSATGGACSASMTLGHPRYAVRRTWGVGGARGGGHSALSAGGGGRSSRPSERPPGSWRNAKWYR